MNKLTSYAVLLGAFFLLQPADAEIYRWVDDQGIPHYSNQQPAARDKSMSVQEEIPYDAEADRRRREADKIAWKEALERESRQEQARLKLEAERLAAQTQRRSLEGPNTVIQNNVYRNRGGAVYFPTYCQDGLPPPCRDRKLTSRQLREQYHRQYYQSSPYFRQHLYYGNTLNYQPVKRGSVHSPTVRPPTVRAPSVGPPVSHPPASGRPRPAPYRR